jgi:hypothetical protein
VEPADRRDRAFSEVVVSFDGSEAGFLVCPGCVSEIGMMTREPTPLCIVGRDLLRASLADAVA